MRVSNKTKIFFFLALAILSVNAEKAIGAAPDFSAQKISQKPASIIELKPGEKTSFSVTFKNTGSRYWSADGRNKVFLRTISGLASKFKSENWYGEETVLMISPLRYIYPNEELILSFELKAPSLAGLQWEKFGLFAGEERITGAEIETPIKVIADGETAPAPMPQPEPQPQPQPEKKYWQTIPEEIKIAESKTQEPKIRVGLLYVEKQEKEKYLPLEILNTEGQLYDILDINNNLLVKNTQGEKVKINFDFDIKKYFVEDAQGRRLLMTDSYLKLAPAKDSIFRIESLKDSLFWGETVNDNEYLGGLEVRFNPTTERLWLINELPLEKYLEGVAEAGDRAPYEFQKAQAIIARTYALFRINNPKYTTTPTGEGIFDLRATQADQVYRGAKKALRGPNFKNAVLETKGVVAAYENKPILAYYFAQSDGKTRAAHLVGMTSGPVPYLIERPDPPGEGKTLLGHGVGLPQRSAITAASEGANFSQIIKYYYPGVGLTRFY